MALADTKDPASLSGKLRARRDVRLRQIIASIAKKNGNISILDLGGTYQYWQRVGLDFLKYNDATITIVNMHQSELPISQEGSPMFRFIVGDACSMNEFEDNSFDFVHSNSVIEHVHTWDNMKAFARETRRLGPSYYVQTPYFWFPIDPHYYRVPMFHWFPRPIRARLLNALPVTYAGRLEGVDLAYATVDAARLLDERQFRFLFPDAKTTFERFIGLPKSMIAVRELG